MEEQNNPQVSKRRRGYLIAYHVLLAVFLSGALAFLVAFTPSMPAGSEMDAAGSSAYRLVIIATLVAMFVAGAAGGILCNLCNDNLLAFLKDNQSKDSDSEIDFYLRPLRGAVTGLLVFFLGNLIVASLSINAAEQSWATMTGRLPYIAVSILAGYASPEFMYRLKEVAKTVFSKDDNGQDQNQPQAH